MFSQHRPIQTITPKTTLRVLADSRFVLVWSDNQWQSTNSTQSRGLGSAGFAVDILPDHREMPAGLSLTFYWPEEDRWLGHNYDIRIEE
jgi:glucoamylase